MRCPRCSNAEVRYSFKGPLERIFTALLPISPFRCRACRHRFWRLDRPVLNPVRGLTLGLITLGLVLGTIRAAGVLQGALVDVADPVPVAAPDVEAALESSGPSFPVLESSDLGSSDLGSSDRAPSSPESDSEESSSSILKDLGMANVEEAASAARRPAQVVIASQEPAPSLAEDRPRRESANPSPGVTPKT